MKGVYYWTIITMPCYAGHKYNNVYRGESDVYRGESDVNKNKSAGKSFCVNFSPSVHITAQQT